MKIKIFATISNLSGDSPLWIKRTTYEVAITLIFISTIEWDFLR